VARNWFVISFSRVRQAVPRMSTGHPAGGIPAAPPARPPTPEENDPSRRPRSRSRWVWVTAGREQPPDQLCPLEEARRIGGSRGRKIGLDLFQHPWQLHQELAGTD
jgi:hypothetical protein